MWEGGREGKGAKEERVELSGIKGEGRVEVRGGKREREGGKRGGSRAKW